MKDKYIMENELINLPEKIKDLEKRVDNLRRFL